MTKSDPLPNKMATANNEVPPLKSVILRAITTGWVKF